MHITSINPTQGLAREILSHLEDLELPSSSIRYSTPLCRHNKSGDCASLSIRKHLVSKTGKLFNIEIIDKDYQNTFEPIEKQLLRERRYQFSVDSNGTVIKTSYQRTDIDFDSKIAKASEPKVSACNPGIISCLKAFYALKMHAKYLASPPADDFLELVSQRALGKLAFKASLHSGRG